MATPLPSPHWRRAVWPRPKTWLLRRAATWKSDETLVHSILRDLMVTAMAMRHTKPRHVLQPLQTNITCRKSMKVLLAEGRLIPGLPVRLHCKADPNFCLDVAPGQVPVMKLTDPSDDWQVSISQSHYEDHAAWVWYKDETMGTRVKDETGASSFDVGYGLAKLFHL